MKKFLSLGEQLRENPKTIWLSIPVLILGIMWYGIKGDKEGQTGGYGHLGLTFRLLHKHQGQSKLFLRISYWLFSQANHIGVGSGLPTVRLKMAQVVAQLGDLKQAKMDIESAIKLCQQTKDISQAAYITAHLGRIKIKLGDLAGAKQWGVSDIAMEALKNIKLVEAARTEAARIVKEDPDLRNYPALAVRAHTADTEMHLE